MSFSQKNNLLQVVISDNGAGYRQNKGKERISRHKSVGMSITQKRMELLGADMENTIDIKEKKNSNQLIVGTEVRVLINTNKA